MDIEDNLQEIARAVMKLRSKEEVKGFLNDIMSPKEIEHITQRWKISKLLIENFSFKEIERATGASSATISKLNQKIKYGSGEYFKILKKILGEEH